MAGTFLAALLVAAGCGESGYLSTTVSDPAFSVRMPEKPKRFEYSDGPISNPGTNYEIVGYSSYQDETSGPRFDAMYLRRPAQLYPASDYQDFERLLPSAAAPDPGYQPTYTRRVTTAGLSGAEIGLQIAINGRSENIYIQYLFGADRLYSLHCRQDDGDAGKPTQVCLTYFASFQPVGAGAAPTPSNSVAAGSDRLSYSVLDPNFTVLMPGKPNRQSSKPVANGPTNTIYTWGGETPGSELFLAGYVEGAGAGDGGIPTAGLCRNLSSDATQDLPDFEENYQNAIRIDGMPGWDISEQASTNGHAFSEFLRCLEDPGHRDYFFQCVLPGTGYAAPPEQCQTYFASFKRRSAHSAAQ